MPQPTFTIKPPIKPRKAAVKRYKDAGAIVREPSNRRKPLEADSCQSVSVPLNENAGLEPRSENQSNKKKINENVANNSIKIVMKNTAGVKKAHKLLLEDINVHKMLTSQLSKFSSKESITRSEIVTISDLVSSYTELSDVELKLVRDFKNYLLSAELSEDQAELVDDCIKPSTIENLLEQSGKVTEAALEKFTRIKQQYPTSPKVLQYLDFVDMRIQADPGNNSNSSKSSKSGSLSSAGGIESLRAKIIKSKDTYDKKYSEIKGQHDDDKVKKDLSFYQSMKRQLEKLETKSSAAFEKLSDKLEKYSDSEEDLNAFEEYVTVYSTQIESFLEHINKSIDSLQTSAVSKKADYSTFFKKQDPPRFKGDCLDYVEWKRRWISQVSSHSPPDVFELDLLKRNLPEDGRKKLFGCDSLPTAWRLLDKMYGDQKLIIQKLKSKLRNLKPKSREPHEIVIELADEVEYLVKRLRLLGATTVLTIDVDFLNSIYKNLPEFHRQKWDDYDQSGYPSEWAAFMSFCNDIYEKAISKRTRMESIREMEKSSKNLPNPVAKVGAVGVDNFTGDENEKFKAKSDKYGNCKICNERHSYTNKFTKKVQPSDKFLNCDSFKSLNKVERGKAIEKYRACRRCLSWGHNVDSCTMKVISCKERINGNECKKDHSRLICGSGVMYCLSVSTLEDGVDELVPTVPLMDDIRVRDGTARTVYDGGSQRVLIDNQFAKEQNLKSEDVIVNLELAGNKTERLETKIFQLELFDNDGHARSVWGYGCDKIMSPYDPVDLRKVRHLFPNLPESAFRFVPERRIDILLGLNFFGLHPRGDPQMVENLVAERSLFNPSGWCIGGSHPLLNIKSTPQLTHTANVLKIAQIQFFPNPDCLAISDSSVVAKVSLENQRFAAVRSDPMLNPEFWDNDNLGVEPPRRCQKCRQCQIKGDCSESHILHTLKEQAELDSINDGITVENGVTRSKWSFLKDPHCLGNNRSKVTATQARLFTNLVREGILEAYNAQIQAGIDSNLWSELSDDELYSYEGPINYITHHAIVKDSSSTPLRVVHNSSLKNGLYSLNSILPKGPSQLNDMLEVALRFRAYESCFGADLRKAYNTILTGLIERNLRRFVWKFSADDKWKTYGINKVHFGESNAANELECAKIKVAKLGESIDREASRKLVRDSFVDDIFSGGSSISVERMVGRRSDDGSRSDGSMGKILLLGGFKVKEFIVEGDPAKNGSNLLSNSMFGYSWNSELGLLSLQFKLSFMKKTRSRKIRPVLTREDLNSLSSITLTKRNLLGITNSFGDFLGISEPFLLRFRLLMKDLFDSKDPLLWDSDIPVEKRDSWISLLAEAVRAGEVVFPRRSRPENSVGGPRIAAFGDGALPAYGGCIYLVWEHACPASGLYCETGSCDGDRGHFSAHLVLGKARVTPLRGFTTPRSELSAGVLVSRMCLRVARALSYLDNEEKPISCVIMLDSECTVATLENSSRTLKPFFLNRKQEILENMEAVKRYCPIEPIQWISSELNISDILTRGTARPEDVGLGSVWQSGPDFLSLPRGSWPVSREFLSNNKDVESKIPREETKTASDFLRVAALKSLKDENIVVPSLFKTVNEILSKSNDIESRKRVLARVIKGWGSCSIETRNARIRENLQRDDLVRAEALILLSSMPETVEALNSGQLDSLLPYRSHGLIVTRGRLGEYVLQSIIGISELPILMPSSRAAELIMWRSHCGFSGILHRSVAETIGRSRQFAWIVKPKDLAKKVCFSCYECRRNKRNLQSQQMARLSEESSTICPPWTFVSIDYAGPFIIRGEVNKRSRSKCWIIAYICRSTKAVCLLPTCGYDTESFLIRHEEFVSRMGQPKSIVSDRGMNLVKSGIVIAEKNSPSSWNWDEVVRRNCASSWEFVPVGAQHRNGLAEATIKVLKQSLQHALPAGTVLSFSELNTLCAKISFAVNARPLGLSNTSHTSQQDDFLSVVTPNQLLLGRTEDTCSPLNYREEDGKFTRRLAYVTSVYESWWSRWIKQVLPTLVPIRRWRQKKKNLSVGDVVMVEYPNPMKDDYRVGKIVAVHPDSSKLVRTVTVAYRRRDTREDPNTYRSKPLTEEKMAVQRLSLLVPSEEQHIGK